MYTIFVTSSFSVDFDMNDDDDVGVLTKKDHSPVTHYILLFLVVHRNTIMLSTILPSCSFYLFVYTDVDYVFVVYSLAYFLHSSFQLVAKTAML